MNLLDIDETPPIAVFEMVKAEAASRGVEIAKSEIVGLIPERALIGAAAEVLKLSDPAEDHLLESKVRASMGPTLDGWLAQLAGPEPTPGGGSAAALAGALAAALVAMVGRLTTGRKIYAEVEDEFRDLTARAEGLRTELRRLVDVDAAAFNSVSAAHRLPKATEPQRAARVKAIDEALMGAATVPFEVAQTAAEVAALARRAAEAGNKNAVSDAAVAATLALAAANGAAYNVEINVAALSQPESGRRLLEHTREYVRQTEESANAAHTAAMPRLA
jgi:glutamate formiminotransferase/formiminotetrahydrofolate cyclodeaminase